MSLRKRWVASCDEEGCSTTLVLESVPYAGKWEHGEALNDAGWDAGQGRPETYCPEHLSEAWVARA